MNESITMFKPGTRWEITHWSDYFDDIYRLIYPNVIEQMAGHRLRIRKDPAEEMSLPKWIDLA